MLHRLLMAWAVVALAAGAAGTIGVGSAMAGGGCHSTVFSDRATATVDLQSNCFSPTVVRVAEGDTITWVNKDKQPHTVTGAVNSFGDYEELLEGESVSHTFAKTGVFPYVCVLHPTMVGAVVVGDGTEGAGVTLGVSRATGERAVASDKGRSRTETAGIAGGSLLMAIVIGSAAYAGARRLRSSAPGD